MSDQIDIDPTKPEEQGAAGGGDENPQDYSVPGEPTETPDEQRRWWEREGARPKDPYRYEKLPQHDQQNFLTKKKDYLPLQRALQKPLSLREILQGMFLQMQKNWEQWKSSNIFPTWTTVKLKCGTYHKKEEG